MRDKEGKRWKKGDEGIHREEEGEKRETLLKRGSRVEKEGKKV